ncbi:MAG: class I SAM-dependent methyltransferase [Thaumarchaeota archaeon]|nr:class I SAM-dependent methyltransferase [Nitrososphaerota archaeon]
MIEQQYVKHHISGWLDGVSHARIIDAGMGYGKWGYVLRLDYPQIDMEIIGLDIYEQAMEFARRLGNAYTKIIKMDLEKDKIGFTDKWANIGLCMGVLAHLTKAGGYHLLGELVRVCDKVVVTAPTTFFQHTSQLNDPYVEPLKHKSAWSEKDFKQLGFKVRGFGWRGRTEKHTYFDSCTEAWTFKFPSLAGGLVAWKE